MMHKRRVSLSSEAVVMRGRVNHNQSIIQIFGAGTDTYRWREIINRTILHTDGPFL
jgi:hypothetical protein